MVQDALVEHLGNLGSTARISELAGRLTAENSRTDQSRVSFLAQLCPKLVVIDDNDFYWHSAALKGIHDEKVIKKQVDAIIKALKEHGEPATIEEIAPKVGITSSREACCSSEH